MNDTEKNMKNQVIAMAAMVQAATLVDKLARTGQDDSTALATLVHGLLQTDPPSTESVYIDRQHLRLGLDVLSHLLQNSERADPGKNYSEILRYVLSLVHLESKLSGDSKMLGQISQRLDHVKKQVAHFSSLQDARTISDPLLEEGLIHETVLGNMASIYTDTLSTYRFRIQVNGNPACLQQPAVVNKIRVLLLCGIRAAVLWRQTGGSRLQVILKRKHYAETARSMLRLATH